MQVFANATKVYNGLLWQFVFCFIGVIYKTGLTVAALASLRRPHRPTEMA